MEQTVLKDWQKRAIDFIFSRSELNDFYLTGGTALAGYYLNHRISDDLDFFSFDFNSEIGVFFRDNQVASELLKIADTWKQGATLFDPTSYKPKWFDFILFG